MFAVSFGHPVPAPPRRSDARPPARPQRKRLRAWLVAAVMLGMAFGFLLGRWSRASPMPEHRHAAPQPSVSTPIVPVPAVDPLQDRIGRLLDDLQQSGQVERVAVVFQDLAHGTGFEIHGDQPFHTASLLKVPLMMAWLQRAQQDPAILAHRLQFPADVADSREDADAPGALLPGQLYTVADLLQRVAVNSRNDARYVLAQNLRPGEVQRIYTDLGIAIAVDGEDDFSCSPHDYAKIFRSLFDATWLARPESKQMLDLLAHPAFRAGLMGGLPSHLTVARKHGVRVRRDATGRIVGAELHECGIVSPDAQPYLLCVMTAGRDINHLARAIGTVVRAIDGDRAIGRQP